MPTGRPNVYLMTFSSYGTWLPGDERGWVDRHTRAWRAESEQLQAVAAGLRTQPAVTLSTDQRREVSAAIAAVCEYRGWWLEALNVRSNHVHVVVQLDDGDEPARAMATFKAWSTRRLRKAGLLPAEYSIWARGGNIRRLPDDASIAAACRYVADSQGPDRYEP